MNEATFISVYLMAYLQDFDFIQWVAKCAIIDKPLLSKI
jgi:hypothetical protein